MDPLSIDIRQARPDAPHVRTVLETHFALMRAASPAESCHVMAPDELLAFDTILFAAWRQDEVLGVAGLSVIAPEHGELKSMHTVEAARGLGVAQALLARVLAEGRVRGISRISLETGSAAVFGPARALYRSNGFELCPPFGAYVADPLSLFMTRSL